MAVWVRVLGVAAAMLVTAAMAGADDTTAPADNRPRDAEESAAPPGVRQFQEMMSGIVRNAREGTVKLLRQTHLTGDWYGGRSWLREHGVSPSGTYFADIQGNPIGGEVGKVRYAHDIGLDVLFDLERLLGWNGSRFEVSMSSRAGNDLSADIGNVFTVAETCCAFTTRLVTFAFEQALFEHRLNVRVGRMSTGDDFMTSPLYLYFVSSDWDANPFSPLINVPYSAYPASTWGARVRGRPIPPVYLAAGVYDGDPDLQRNRGHGVDFSIGDAGVLLTFEAGYQPAYHRKDALPGNYKVGGYYDTGRYTRFDAPPDSDLPSTAEHGNGGYYFLADQMLYREDGDQGLWPFVGVVIAPSEEINIMPVFVGGGITYQGLFPGRDADVSVASIAYGGFSSDLRRSQAGSPQGQQDFEMVIEWGYIIEVAPWLHVQPDFQYIIKPGGTGNIPDALVIGAQIGINL